MGAIVDFGDVGDGLQITAYDGAGGTGNILGQDSTITESFIGVTATGIKSVVFSQAGADSTWAIDNLTYEVSQVPLPAGVWLFGSSLLGLGVLKRRKV